MESRLVVRSMGLFAALSLVLGCSGSDEGTSSGAGAQGAQGGGASQEAPRRKVVLFTGLLRGTASFGSGNLIEDDSYGIGDVFVAELAP